MHAADRSTTWMLRSPRPASRMGYPAAMNDDRVNDRIDAAVLALLYMAIFERHPAMGARTWKPFDWAAMNRLHHKGLISDPVSKAKSVMLTKTGLRQAEAVFQRLFETDAQAEYATDAITAASREVPHR